MVPQSAARHAALSIILCFTDLCACKRVPQRRWAYYSTSVRPWLRAAGASGWAFRSRRGRAHGPVLGSSALALAVEQLATRGPGLRPRRRAGPRQKGLTTNVLRSQRTPRRALLVARGELGAGQGHEQNTAPKAPPLSLAGPARNGIECSVYARGSKAHVLIYADDVVILSDSPSGFQKALDSAAAWARP